MTVASAMTILRGLLPLFGLFLLLSQSAALATPDLRVFVVDASMFALLDQSQRRETRELVAADIRRLSGDPASAPSRGSVLVYQGRSTIDVFTSEEAAGEIDPARSAGLEAAIERGVAGRIAGGLDLVALRDTLLRIIADRDLVAGAKAHAVELHVFAAEWRTGAGREHRIASYDKRAEAIAISRRPSQCFVNDVGAAGASRSPWPQNVALGVELRPAHRLPTPSPEALADLAAVLTLRASDAPFLRSLGIAGPLCPTGEPAAFSFTGLADPADCDGAETALQTASSIDLCRPGAPVLPPTDAALVRRPLSAVVIDGDAAAAALETRFAAGRPAFPAALFLGAEPLDATGSNDLRQLAAGGRNLPLRVSLQDPGAGCAGAAPFSASFALGETQASFVTAPIDCAAFGPGGALTFDLFGVTVN